MAASSLLALLDDVASVLDDVAVLTKTATSRTAGVIGDDLAVNAEQVSGIRADRELPVVWAVFKGSLLNKAILVPAALLISAVAPWAITPLLILGGLFLCFEGFEKLLHLFLEDQEENVHHQALSAALADPGADLAALEAERVRGAIRTDFVLSAEIVAISLGVVADSPFGTQATVLTLLSIAMTVGVYGLVAGIVKLDDAGVWLQQQSQPFRQRIGSAILSIAPRMMQALTLVGMIAMFLVGGGIIEHGVPLIHHATEALVNALSSVPLAETIAPLLWQLAIGVLAGVMVTALVKAAAAVRGALSP